MRGDEGYDAHSESSTCFDPRPCMRGDLCIGYKLGNGALFRSAPLHEGRLDTAAREIERLVSIRAPA